MPWGIRGGYLINLDTGARKNKKPMSPERLRRYQRALYANVPEARRAAKQRHKSSGGYSDTLHPRDKLGRWRHKEFQNRLRSMQGRWLKRLRKGRPLRLKMWNPRQKRDKWGRWAPLLGGLGFGKPSQRFRVASRLHAYPAKTYHGLLRRMPGPQRMMTRVAVGLVKHKLNPPTLLDVIEGGVDELYLAKKRRLGHKEYNPGQKRIPKGQPHGGQWAKMAGSAAIRLASLVRNPKSKLVPTGPHAKRKLAIQLMTGIIGFLAARSVILNVESLLQIRSWMQHAGVKTAEEAWQWFQDFGMAQVDAQFVTDWPTVMRNYAKIYPLPAPPTYPLLPAGLKDYNPRQRRYPKGTARGGEWMPVGGRGGSVTEALHQLINPTARAIRHVSEDYPQTLPVTSHRELWVNGRKVGGAYTGERIYVSAHYDRPHMNAAHEIGHALDHNHLGTLWASENSRELNGLRNAINRSQKVKELRAWHAMGAVFYQGRRIPISPGTTHHLLQPKELFARAFEQHYAKHSRHGAARKELRLAQSHPLSYYWNDKDFSRIDNEMSRVLKRHGYR